MAMLDNLTSTIVIISLLARVRPDADTRRYLGAVVVIAANAGGAWSPLGDVTTTMLWVDGQVTPGPTIS
jgi:Na+/H+ antiporter NhaD/arsenite permease-like protein